jgi:hypothetical protein
VKKTQRMEKVMKVYCEKKELKPEAVTFSFNGKRVEKDDTPKMVGSDYCYLCSGVRVIRAGCVPSR